MKDCQAHLIQSLWWENEYRFTFCWSKNLRAACSISCVAFCFARKLHLATRCHGSNFHNDTVGETSFSPTFTVQVPELKYIYIKSKCASQLRHKRKNAIQTFPSRSAMPVLPGFSETWPLDEAEIERNLNKSSMSKVFLDRAELRLEPILVANKNRLFLTSEGLRASFKSKSAYLSHPQQIPKGEKDEKGQDHPRMFVCWQKTHQKKKHRHWNFFLMLPPSINMPLVTSLLTVNDIHKALKDLETPTWLKKNAS